jgi:hypothetical protein
MAPPERMQVAADEPEQSPDDERQVSFHHTTPDRFVFTEAGNCDGWIATDLTVDLER